MDNKFDIPILFLIFNRPKQTKIVFDRIKEIRPKFLYIAADGPREDNESDKRNCPLVRNIVRDIDWDCEVKTLYREQNLGCKLAVSSSITWFFDNVEMGIILEDDCLPDRSFFYYCSEMLARYKNDERIMVVSGFNRGIKNTIKYDYFFSSYIQIWGWASWRRAWNKYDVKMSHWNLIKNNLDMYFFNKRERGKRKINFQKSYDNKINTWDFIWHLTVVVNNGLAIIPKNNLVTNIGFTGDGTHITDPSSSLANLKIQPIDYNNISHPPFIVYSKEFENYHRLRFLGIKYLLKGVKLILFKIKSIFSH